MKNRSQVANEVRLKHTG